MCGESAGYVPVELLQKWEQANRDYISEQWKAEQQRALANARALEFWGSQQARPIVAGELSRPVHFSYSRINNRRRGYGADATDSTQRPQ